MNTINILDDSYIRFMNGLNFFLEKHKKKLLNSLNKKKESG